MRKSPQILTYLSCDSSYSAAELILFGAPFDGTSSFRPGSRFAPAAIRQDSYGIETYSPYWQRDLIEHSLCDIGDLDLPFGNPPAVLAQIEELTAEILADGKFPLMLGGEHLISLGALRAALQAYPDLCLLHFDAHTDLRDHYLGESLSHASVIRRCWDLLGDDRIFSLGIRSGDRAEWDWAKKHIRLCPFDFSGLPEMLAEIGTRPIYLTIDLDVLDPAELPGTGTPEAGGMRFTDILSMLQSVEKAVIVAADVNELSPALDASGRSTALAVKLIRELILTVLKAKATKRK